MSVPATILEAIIKARPIKWYGMEQKNIYPQIRLCIHTCDDDRDSHKEIIDVDVFSKICDAYLYEYGRGEEVV